MLDFLVSWAAARPGVLAFTRALRVQAALHCGGLLCVRGSSSPTAHRPDRPSGEPPPREEHLPRKGLTGALRSSSEQGRELQEDSGPTCLIAPPPESSDGVRTLSWGSRLKGTASPSRHRPLSGSPLLHLHRVRQCDRFLLALGFCGIVISGSLHHL